MWQAVSILVLTVDAMALLALWLSAHQLRSKLLWSVAVLALPIVGAVFYFVMGDEFGPRAEQ